MTKFYLGIFETVVDIHFGVVGLVSMYVVMSDFGEHHLDILPPNLTFLVSQ